MDRLVWGGGGRILVTMNDEIYVITLIHVDGERRWALWYPDTPLDNKPDFVAVSVRSAKAKAEKHFRRRPLMLWKRISPNGLDTEADTPLGTYTISFDHPAVGGAAYLFVPNRDDVYLTIMGPGAKIRAMNAARYHLENNMRFSRG